MSTISKKAFIQYQNSRKTLIINSAMSQKELFSEALKLFEINSDEWVNYELILIEFDCRITCSAQLLIGDILELRERKESSQHSTQETHNNSSEVESGQKSMLKEELQQEDKPSYQFMEDEEVQSNGTDQLDWEDNSMCDENEYEVENQDDSRENQNDEVDFEINISRIKSTSFQDRKELKTELDKWGALVNTKLYFNSQERENPSTGLKVSTLYCINRKKTGCKFYLEFRTNPDDNLYSLNSSYNNHNHSLLKFHDSSAVTPEIIEKIKELLPIVKDYKSLTVSINKTFKLNFHSRTLYYQIKKIGEIEYGKPTEDAELLISMLEEDAKDREGFYSVQFENNRLKHCCYMSSRMRSLFEYFNDVVIIDTTHKLNRFNLPFLDVTLVNNMEKSVTAFFALLSDQKYESFQWALSKLKTQLRRMPIVIFSDNESALRKGTC